MQKIKNNCFTVVLSNDLYVYVEETSSSLHMSASDYIQKLVDKHLKHAMQKTSARPFDSADAIRQPEDQGHPSKKLFSFDDVIW